MNVETTTNSPAPAGSGLLPSSERGLLEAAAYGNGLTAADIMHQDVITLDADMSLNEAANSLTYLEISGAPVTNRANKLIGVLSLSDIVEAASEGIGDFDRSQRRAGESWDCRFTRDDLSNLAIHKVAATIEDIMTPHVHTVAADTPLGELARTMLSERIHRLFVTQGKDVVGIVTTLDILKVIAR